MKNKRQTPKIHTVPNPGDKITLDRGYGPHESWQNCIILSIGFASGLFDSNQDLCATVREPNGSIFNTTLIPNI